MSRKIRIIIPVAGAGTRLQPHTLTLPKALLPVGGKPALAHVLEPLVALDPEEVVFVVGHLGDQIMEYVRANFEFRTRFVPQEKLLGLGYALHLAMEGLDERPTLIILGDTVVECDYEAFLGAGDYVLGLRAVDNPHRFGIAEVDGGYIVGLEEKPEDPKTNLALIGLYCFSETAQLRGELEHLVRTGKTTGGEIQLTDALHAMIESGIRFAPYEVAGWYDCGKMETLISSNREILKKSSQPEAPAGSVFVPPVYVAPSAKIINSIIGPNVSIGGEVTIERSVVSNAIIGERSHIVNAVIDHTLIGRDVLLHRTPRHMNLGDKSQVRDV